MEYYQSLQEAYGPPGRASPAPAPKPKARKTSAVVEKVMQALPIDPGNGTGGYEPGNMLYEHFASPPAKTYVAPSYYEPTSDAQLANKLQYAIQLLERRGLGNEPTSTNDIILYSFTGIFMLFVLDNFVRLGHRIERL